MKKEVRRQLLHIIVGLVLANLIYFEIAGAFFFAVFAIIGLLVSALCKRYHVPFFSWGLKQLEREGEKIPGRGLIAYFLGCMMVLLLFNKNIALASIMVLALGDSVSLLVGRYHAKRKKIENKKLLQGWAAGVVAGSIGAWLFVPFVYAFAGAIAAMTIETIELGVFDRVVDDNLYIPLIAGIVIYVLMAL